RKLGADCRAGDRGRRAGADRPGPGCRTELSGIMAASPLGIVRVFDRGVDEFPGDLAEASAFLDRGTGVSHVDRTGAAASWDIATGVSRRRGGASLRGLSQPIGNKEIAKPIG